MFIKKEIIIVNVERKRSKIYIYRDIARLEDKKNTIPTEAGGELIKVF